MNINKWSEIITRIVQKSILSNFIFYSLYTTQKVCDVHEIFPSLEVHNKCTAEMLRLMICTAMF